VNDIG